MYTKQKTLFKKWKKKKRKRKNFKITKIMNTTIIKLTIYINTVELRSMDTC